MAKDNRSFTPEGNSGSAVEDLYIEDNGVMYLGSASLAKHLRKANGAEAGQVCKLRVQLTAKVVGEGDL